MVRMSERSREHQSCSVPSLEEFLRTGGTGLPVGILLGSEARLKAC